MAPSEYQGHDEDAGTKLKPAAQYIRMSTEHQQYSTENQADIIREHAKDRGYEIVRTYVDEGKSGLRIEGRDALRQMIADVQEEHPGYEAILVYDVSRWGRFQDSDESAYYEYICRRGLASRCTIAPSNLRMMAAQHQPLSKASSAQWLASTAGNCHPKCSRGNVG